MKMFTKTRALVATLFCSWAVAAPLAVREDSIDCSDTAHLIVARGSIGDPLQCGTSDHIGNLQNLTLAVQRRATGHVSVSGVVYPATTGDPCSPDFNTSRTLGEKNMKLQIRQRVDQCGDRSNIVLVGYSQGAFVITDMLSGGSSTGVTALAPKYAAQLKAVVLFANPSQQPGAPYNYRKDAPDGSPPAPNGPSKPYNASWTIPHPEKVRALGERVVAYCEKYDVYCDAPNPYGGQVHSTAVETWSRPAINFILSRIKV